jgi:hypothetical protein
MNAALVTGPVLLGMFGVAAIALIVMAIFLQAIWRKQVERDKSWNELQQTVAALKSDQRFYLTTGSLGPLHEKINGVSRDVSEQRGDLRAMREQLRLIDGYLRNRQ